MAPPKKMSLGPDLPDQSESDSQRASDESEATEDTDGPPLLSPETPTDVNDDTVESADSAESGAEDTGQESQRRSTRPKKTSTRIRSPTGPPKLKKEKPTKEKPTGSASSAIKTKTTPRKIILTKTPKMNASARKAKMRRSKRDPSVEENQEQKQKKQLEISFCVPERKPNGKASCFICSDDSLPSKPPKVKSDADKKDLVACGIGNCGQKMHLSCLETFVCAEYRPEDAALLFRVENPVCPAHFCWHCYDERCKNASRFGDLVDCTDCVRSFHNQCVPAGAKIEKHPGKRSTTKCLMHANSEDIKNYQRLKHCTECEQLLDESITKGEEQRMTCDGCTNVFHLKCSFKKVQGKLGNAYKNNFCSYCVNSAVIVPNQYVLAYCGSFHGYGRGNYPGKALARADVPANIRKQLGASFDKFGWIPIQWIWDMAKSPYFNMVHKSKVQRIFLGCDANIGDKDVLNEIRRSSKNFSAPTYPLEIHAMRKTITPIKTIMYYPGVERIREKKDYAVCECKPKEGSKIKCETADCHNRLTSLECTMHCDDVNNGIFCANRAMQAKKDKKDEPVKYEVREAEKGKGFGVFAIAPIKANEYLFEYAGEVIDMEEHKKREARVAQLRSHDEFTYMMGLKKNYIVDARFYGNVARYVNHSCDPNSEVETVDIPVQIFNEEFAMFEPRIKVTTLKEIKAGEEITFSYQLTKSKGLAVDNCKCGAKNCKGKIGQKRNNDDTDDEFFDKNKPLTVDEDDRIEIIEGSEGSEGKDEKENSPKRRSGAVKKEQKKVKKETSVEKSGGGVKKRRGSIASGTPKRVKEEKK